MKLEVGMYVRTKNGIDKIRFISEVMCGLEETLSLTLEKEIEEVLKKDITKASHNIIDLIEVGDYVNGYRVDCIENINANNIFILQRIFCEEYEKALYAKSFKPSEIKSIVTKEQFEAIRYEL